MKTPLDKLFKDINTNFLQQYKGLIVSCSGGLDSTTLLYFLNKLFQRETKIPLSVLHFNFGLRGKESDEDETFVKRLAETYGLPFILHRAPTDLKKNPTKNIQSWARAIRLNKFAELTKEGWAVSLAHHHDDLAENVLLRLIRGTSPGSLLGMKAWNAPFWRPFLNISRKDISEWHAAHYLEHRIDSSNNKRQYSRNIIRHDILPAMEKLNPHAKEHIVRCGQEIDDFVVYTRRSLLEKNEIIQREDNGDISLDQEFLSKLPKGLAYDALSCAIGRHDQNINHQILETAYKGLSEFTGEKPRALVELPAGKRVITKSRKIFITNKSVKSDNPRKRQHAASLFLDKNTMILGPSATVEFFPS